MGKAVSEFLEALRQRIRCLSRRQNRTIIMRREKRVREGRAKKGVGGRDRDR